MSKYQLIFTEEAADDLDGIKKYYARQIISRVEVALLHAAEDVTRSSVKKLRGFESLYRLRVGDDRVFYRVKSDEVTLLRILSKEKEQEFYKEAKSHEGGANL